MYRPAFNIRWLTEAFVKSCLLLAGNQVLRSSTPIPRPKFGARAWGVHVSQNGLLDVADKPPVRQATLDLLSAVLDSGHEMTEDEMTGLFEARGADFDAICSAAGILHPVLSLS